MTSPEIFDLIHHLAETDPVGQEINCYLARLSNRIQFLSSHIKKEIGAANAAMPLRTLPFDEAAAYVKLATHFMNHGLTLCLLAHSDPDLAQIAARPSSNKEPAM